jgi:hypothetical protein
MSGHSVFDQLVTEVARPARLKVWSGRIDVNEYELWRKDFIWEALHGQRYGQSFCNRFGLHDNHLFYNTGSVEWADEYIRKTYID